MCIEELTWDEEIDLVEWKRRGAVAETVVRAEEEVEANKAFEHSVGSEQAVLHRRASIATTSLQHTLTHRLRRREREYNTHWMWRERERENLKSSTVIDLDIFYFGNQGSKPQRYS